MKHLVWAALALGVLVAGPATAGEIVKNKPIDTNLLVVKPSRAAADIAAGTIELAGNTAAGAIESDGFVKTFNNLFGFRRNQMSTVQPGRSPLPIPQLFQYTQYRTYIKPVMPSSQPVRRR